MTQSVIPGGVIGPLGPMGATGPTGPTGPPGVGGTLESTLATAINIGDAAVTLANAAPVTTAQGYIAIDPFLSTCEIRSVKTVSGTGISGLTAFQVAHSVGARVFFFTDDSIPAFWFGCKGDGAAGSDVGTDDSATLQWAMMECAREGLWLHGQNRNYYVSIPMVIGPSGKLRHLNLRVKAAFAPIETTSAILIHEQNFELRYTVSASTDVFTTPVAHLLAADGARVMFKVVQGGTTPGGITAGKLYYVRDRTATTFKVSATPGGAAVDVTADGSGHVFCELLSLHKVYIDDVFINGRNLAAGATKINGAAFDLQQPTYIRKLRIDQCSGTALTVGGQQAIFENFEAITSGTGCAIENLTEGWFFGFDVEQFTNVALDVRAVPQIFALGGAYSCLFDGIHIETAPANGVAFNLEGGAHNLDFNNTNITIGSGQTGWHVHGVSANSNAYRIRGVRVSGAAGVSGTILLNDENRGVVLDSWDDFHHIVDEIVGPYMPSTPGDVDPGGRVFGRVGGGYVRWGSQNAGSPSMQMRPGSSQTGEQLLWRDKSGNKASWVNKDGYYMTTKTSAPGDADLAAGQLAIWFDQTDGAAKAMFKGKSANGTVRTGSVPLT